MKKYQSKLFILGAGFSKPAKFPLGIELWKEILKRLKPLTGRASKLNDDIVSFIEFQKEVYGNKLTPHKINFEDLLGFLDIEHYLGLRGSDTFSNDGNEGSLVVKSLIGEILSELSPKKDNIPSIYLEFVRKLKPGDNILTFNYDVLLERALEAENIKYRLYPTRLKEIRRTEEGYETGLIDSAGEDEIVLLKLHGSIDWFEKPKGTIDVIDFNTGKTESDPDYLIFNNTDKLNLEPIIDTPYYSNDPIQNVFRAKNVELIDYKKYRFVSPPFLLTPSTYKHVYFNKMHNFWDGMYDLGYFFSQIVIIGYSFPRYDPYSLQAIYRILKNYQSKRISKEHPNLVKNKILIVNYFKDKLESNCYKSTNLRFIDWSNAIYYDDGFDSNVISLIS